MTSSSRACAHCNQVFPVESFPIAKGNSRRKDGRHSYCRDCKNESLAEWRRDHPEQVAEQNRRYKDKMSDERRDAKRAADRTAYHADKRRHRDAYLRRTFGVSLDRYEELLARQANCCAICATPCSSGRALAVDHDHSTGKPRGLLCSNCNNGLGRFRDDVARLANAIAYLESYTT